MSVIVTTDVFSQAIKAITDSSYISLDTETTGLYYHKGHRLFSIIIGTADEEYYFNYNADPDHLGNVAPTILPRSTIPQILENFTGRIFMQNPVFDILMMLCEKADLTKIRIYAVEALARIVNNDRFAIGMSTLAKDIGLAKSDEVKHYCTENKLFRKYKVRGIKTEKKEPLFYKVPFDIMFRYGCQDARVTYDLGIHYFQKITVMPNPHGWDDVVQTERDLVPVLAEMKLNGIKVDKDYCERAYEYYTNKKELIASEYKRITGIEFKDSGKNHAQAFDILGFKYPLTPKGNPSFTKDLLENLDTPIANVIKDYRKADKKASFFASYVYHADKDGFIHASLNQAATRTGRFSSSDPNLQQVPKRGDSGSTFPVRNAFVPRSDEYILFALDFDQFEYRMMLNKAEEMGVIAQVLDGLDVHTATDNQMGINDRDKAKTMNFLLLYGGGIAVMAMALYKTHLPEHILKDIQKYHFFKDYLWDNLRIAEEMELSIEDVEHGVEILTKASNLKKLYFRKLEAVELFVKRTIGAAESGSLYNDFGRMYRFKYKDFCYKAPNYLIQGETADWIKRAMIKLHELFKDKKSMMVLQVHDELLFEIHKDELDLVPQIKDIMENVAPTKHLPYTVGVDYSRKSWGDKVTLKNMEELYAI